MKNHIRDYATEAFRFYARSGKSAYDYKKKIYDDALESYTKKLKSPGVSCPTESAIINAERAVEEKLAEIKDMEAVELTLAELRASILGRAMVQAIEYVYFEGADKELEKGDISARVHKAELYIPASERSIYSWLGKARKIFAENRGLRL